MVLEGAKRERLLRCDPLPALPPFLTDPRPAFGHRPQCPPHRRRSTLPASGSQTNCGRPSLSPLQLRVAEYVDFDLDARERRLEVCEEFVEGRSEQALPEAVSRSIAKTTVEILTLRPTMSYGLPPARP